ncbi:MAG: nucleotidyltransferase family protein [Candidatus Omnitrophica bacterium]|nr:nucleotidyltransferase family protein [Candidatus Omnitrophota bacterium]
MKAVILAAGYATRLYPLTLDTPKCLLSVGGKAMLDHLCENLQGLPAIDEILIVTNAKFFQKLRSWKEKSRFSVPIDVLNDGTDSNENRLGAIGDLSLVIEKKRIKTDFLMLAADNLFEEPLAHFVGFAQSRGRAVSMGVVDIHDAGLAANRFGVVEMSALAEVLSFEEKPAHPKSSLIATGIYYFPAFSVAQVREYLAQGNVPDAPGHYLKWLVGRTKIFGFLIKGMWYDIGDLKALEEANRIFKGKVSS